MLPIDAPLIDPILHCRCPLQPRRSDIRASSAETSGRSTHHVSPVGDAKRLVNVGGFVKDSVPSKARFSSGLHPAAVN